MRMDVPGAADKAAHLSLVVRVAMRAPLVTSEENTSAQTPWAPPKQTGTHGGADTQCRATSVRACRALGGPSWTCMLRWASLMTAASGIWRRKPCNQFVAICDACLRPRDGERTSEDTPTSMARAGTCAPVPMRAQSDDEASLSCLPPLYTSACGPRRSRAWRATSVDDEHLVRAETVRQHGGAGRRHQNHVLNMPVADMRFEGEDHALL